MTTELGPRRGGRNREPVYRITSTAPGLSEDLAGRQFRYLISMGIRTSCFVGAVIASGWLRWTLVVGAIFLPYIAVVIANAGRERAGVPPVAVVARSRRGLPAAAEVSQPTSPARHAERPDDFRSGAA